MRGPSAGLYELAGALRVVRAQFGCEVVSGSIRLPDGHLMTVRVTAHSLELIKDTGERVEAAQESGGAL